MRDNSHGNVNWLENRFGLQYIFLSLRLSIFAKWRRIMQRSHFTLRPIWPYLTLFPIMSYFTDESLRFKVKDIPSFRLCIYLSVKPYLVCRHGDLIMHMYLCIYLVLKPIQVCTASQFLVALKVSIFLVFKWLFRPIDINLIGFIAVPFKPVFDCLDWTVV